MHWDLFKLSSCHSWDCLTSHSWPSQLSRVTSLPTKILAIILQNPPDWDFMLREVAKTKGAEFNVVAQNIQLLLFTFPRPSTLLIVWSRFFSGLPFLSSPSEETFVFYQEEHALRNLARLHVVQSSECFLEISEWQLPVGLLQEVRASLQKYWPSQNNCVLLAEVPVWRVILSSLYSRLDILLHQFI